MALVAAITDVGIAQAELAQAGGFQIVINSAQFSGDLLTPPTATHLQSLTFMTNVVYTAPTSDIQYHVVNTNTIMFRVLLPVTTVPATFNFGSYSLNLADGTPFAIGTWTTMQTKDGNSARYVELTIVFSNALGTINLTILNTIDAALPEVANETQLPPAASAPYPVYFVHQLNYYQQQPALASRYNGAWYYYPSQEVWYYQDVGSTNVLVANTPGLPGNQPWVWLARINVPIYVRVKNTNTGNVLFNLDGLGNYPVLNMDGTNIIPGQLVANSVVALFFDVSMTRPGGGTQAWQLLTSVARPSRVRLQSTLILYVSPTGNDSNDGLSAATAFLHPQRAWDYIVNNIDANGQNIGVILADGDYTSGVFANGMPLGSVGGINFLGNSTTPGNVRITVPTGNCFSQGSGGSTFQIDSMRLSASTKAGDYVGGGDGIGSNAGCICWVRNIEFGQVAQSHMDAEGGVVSSLGRSYTIVGGGTVHIIATFGQASTADGFVIVKGIVNFSAGFVLASGGGNAAVWNQQWGSNQIVSVKVSNVGTGLNDGIRTFTAYGGYYQAPCVWTAQVSGGSVVPGTESISQNGNYYAVTKQIIAQAPAGTVTLSVSETSQIADGMSAGHLNLPAGTKIQSHTGNTITLDHAVIAAGIAIPGGSVSDSNVTFLGMPSMADNPASVDAGASNATWDLSITTGPKFSVSSFGYINVNGAGLKYLPGSSAGYIQTATYGLYL